MIYGRAGKAFRFHAELIFHFPSELVYFNIHLIQENREHISIWENHNNISLEFLSFRNQLEIINEVVKFVKTFG